MIVWGGKAMCWGRMVDKRQKGSYKIKAFSSLLVDVDLKTELVTPDGVLSLWNSPDTPASTSRLPRSPLPSNTSKAKNTKDATTVKENSLTLFFVIL